MPMTYQTSNQSYGNFTKLQKQSSIKKLPLEKKQPQAHKGLINIGNSCYFASVLQILFQIFNFSQLKLEYDKKPLTRAFVQLYKSPCLQSFKDFRNVAVKKIPMLQDSLQQDTEQFFTSFLQQLNKQNVSINPNKKIFKYNSSISVQQNLQNFQQIEKLNQSFFSRYFLGIFLQEFTCQANRSHSKYVPEKFNQIYLSFPQKTKKCSIQTMVENFFRKEKIANVLCDSCKTKRAFQKKIQMIKYPKFLVLHLKRFSHFDLSQKLTTELQFSQQLTLKYGDKIATYELIGLIQHHGRIDTGHYICLKKKNNTWYIFNDEKVNMIQFLNSSRNVYMLFYKNKVPS